MKILISSGGTGGHVFPAQALAEELQAKGVETFFIGGGLGSNRYFKREKFAYSEIASATLSKGNFLFSFWRIAKGFWQSFRAIGKFRPDAVVGFGSFYSFPVLLAAVWKKIPIILFEPNAIPGKVNRFFSRWAVASAVQFSEAARKMKGKSVEVKMPTAERKKESLQEARDYFYLAPDLFTFLVFGGSQGAQSINLLFSEAVPTLPKDLFQIVHITGKAESADAVRLRYEAQNIRSCVKAFEERMEYAWSAADMVVCRAGAATVAEQVAFEVPGILIPFPKAADDHQTHNALFIEKEVGGAVTCPEALLSAASLSDLLRQFLDPGRLQQMKAAIAAFKKGDSKPDLCTLILDTIGK